MNELIALSVSVATIVLGYVSSRRFVRDRLRYVDAAQRGVAPWIAGAAAAIVTTPLTAVLPLIGVGTALAFGASVAAGVAHGQRDIRRRAEHLIGPGV